MEGGAEESKEEHAGDIPGQEEGKAAGSENPYAEKGWTDNANGRYGGGSVGDPGMGGFSNGKLGAAVITVFVRLGRKPDEGPGFVLGKLLNEVQRTQPTPNTPGPQYCHEPYNLPHQW